MVRQVTAKGRFARAAGRGERLVPEQPALVRSATSIAHLSAMMRGHYRLLRRWRQQSTLALVSPIKSCGSGEVVVAAGSSGRGPMGPLQRTPGTASTAASQDHPSLRCRERSSLVKNRMREICTSGSVRGGGGNVPTYSAFDSSRTRREMAQEGASGSADGAWSPKKLQLAGS